MNGKIPVFAGQGTRLRNDVAPWETYASEMEVKMGDKLRAEVEEYSKRRHDNKPSAEAEEALAYQKEVNQQISKQYQFMDPKEYENEDARLGRIMHSSILISKLRSECGLNCWYIEHPHKDKLILLVKKDCHRPEVGCWVQRGWAPEYEMVRFDERGMVRDSKYRGTRTVLLQLILKGYLKEEVAHRVFGHAAGPAANKYLRTLYAIRNN